MNILDMSKAVNVALERLLTPLVEIVAELEVLKRREALRPDEVTKLFGLNTSTLAAYRMRGIGPKFLRLGSNIMYRPEDVRKWLASKEPPKVA